MRHRCTRLVRKERDGGGGARGHVDLRVPRRGRSDPLGAFALTYQGYANAIQAIVKTSLPVLLLGGGGYCAPDAARCFTHVVAAACGVPHLVPTEVPSHAHFQEYGPRFCMADMSKKSGIRRKAKAVPPERLEGIVSAAVAHLGSLRRA